MTERDAGFEGLPIHGTSWDPDRLDFPEEADFQAGIQEWILQGEMEDPPDAIMGGKPVPRIWLLLHEPGAGRLAAVTALTLARELMARDQAVLVLDCDDEDPVLTRWAEREGREGWIDLIRYGASLLTCGLRLPFPGKQGLVLGPGSYHPVDAQPAEIEQLLVRLRRHADDILLCCPIDDRGRAWAGQADIRAFCWEPGRLDADRLRELTAGLEAAGTPLTGLIRFGDAEPAEAAESPAPTGAPAEPGAETGPSDSSDVSDDTEVAHDPDASDVPDDTGAPADRDPADVPSAAPAGAAPDLQPPAGEEPDAPLPPEQAVFGGPEQYARKRGTSRVFWWTALGAIALIAASIWYYREYVMVSPLDAGPGLARTETRPVPAEPVERGVQPPTQDPAGGTGTGDDQAPDPTVESPDESLDESLDESPDESTTGPTTGLTAGPADSSAASRASAVAAEKPETSRPPAESAEEDGFYMDPYLVPVGGDGWAIHVYSFPDDGSADVEIERLRDRGFQTARRTVQIKDKGRWVRIYLGSFPDRAAAREALDPLLRELDEDWGRPTQF